MALQLFGAPRALEPLHLNPTAVRFAQRGTDFLAFNRPLSSEPAVEFATAQSAPTWPGVWPGGLKVRDTDPELRHSFAKPGIFGFRYKDIANPVAYASDYNIDFGPGHKGPGVVAAERLAADAWDPKQDPMPPPPMRQMIFTEKESGTGGSPLVKPPANAYSTYGYQEVAAWLPRAGASTSEKTVVMNMDPNKCRPGESLVNGFCFASTNARTSCPPGWQYGNDGQCHRAAERANGAADGAAIEGVTRKECPPGWSVRNGQCVATAERAHAASLLPLPGVRFPRRHERASADPLQGKRHVRPLRK